MIREELMKRAQSKPTAFRWRGGDVSRLEGFSDAVFAFALTLLVVSLQVPKTFDELLVTMRGFVAFAICFCLLAMVWYDHYLLFRHYGLKDTSTVVLNTVAQMGCDIVLIGIGLISIALACGRTPALSIASGSMYWTIGIAMTIYWSIAGARRRKLEARV